MNNVLPTTIPQPLTSGKWHTCSHGLTKHDENPKLNQQNKKSIRLESTMATKAGKTTSKVEKN